MDQIISEHVTKFVLTETAGRNCFCQKRPFRTPGVSQQCTYYLQWKIIREQAFTILRRRELPREAFLGEMVVGHKNSKSHKFLFPRANCENIHENRGYSGKMCVNYV